VETLNILHFAIRHPGATCVWITLSHYQALRASELVKREAANFVFQHDVALSGRYFNMRFANGSTILFYTPKEEAALRGRTLNYIGLSKGISTTDAFYKAIRVRQFGAFPALCVRGWTPVSTVGNELLFDVRGVVPARR
jgi:hypothetical protein